MYQIVNVFIGSFLFGDRQVQTSGRASEAESGLVAAASRKPAVCARRDIFAGLFCKAGGVLPPQIATKSE